MAHQAKTPQTQLPLFRPLPFVLLVSLAVHLGAGELSFGSAPERAAAAAANLAPEYDVSAILASEFNISASPSDVRFVDAPRGISDLLHPARVFFLGTQGSDIHDVYLAWVRRSPEGHVLSVEDVFNLSQTSAANEAQLATSGGAAAWVIGNEQRVLRLKLVNSDAPAQRDPRAQTGLKRLQQDLTFLQRTGQRQGLAERDFKFDPPASWVRISAAPDGLRVVTDHTSLERRAETEDHESSAIEIPWMGKLGQGAHHLSEQTGLPAAPGNLVTWAVDRLRGMRWFGDERMQVLKAVAYRLLDFKDRTLGDEEEAPHIPNDLQAATRREAAPGQISRFPPEPLEPELEPAFEDEGVWLSLEKDPFVRKLPNGSSPFVTTFIRNDKERKFSRIMITAWDPSVVELHMMSGTEEPKSATGETGAGMIPRDPGTLTRLVAAFNGGFQGTHGDFGMQVKGTLYVPPKPYAATVVRLADSRVGFGTWPEPMPNGPAIPEYVDSFRQNLTPLLQDGNINPYGRVWWGGVPHEWEDTTRTVRSGLCLTKKGLVAYFYGSKVDHLHLARAMQQMNCDYGLHLDMNQGHTGLEFYQVAAAAELPPLGMPLSPMWQAEGPVEGAPGFNFRGRRLFRSMQLMNFPRYIRTEARDFFYLTLKRRLPGSRAIVSGAAPEPSEGHWTTTESTHVNSAPAFATTWLRPDVSRPATKVRLLSLDVSLVAPHPRRPIIGEPPLLSIDAAGSVGSDTWAWWSDGRAIIGKKPSGQAVALLAGTKERGSEASAAFGLGGGGQFLFYAEIATAPQPAEDAALLSKALEAAGASELAFMRNRPTLSSGGVELSGHPHTASDAALHLVASPASEFRLLFKDTPIVERPVWRPMQKSIR